MRAWIYPYALQSKGALNNKTARCSHNGVLFRIEFPGNGVGYSDCHPWPELGDLPLQIHLKLLKSGHLTRAVEQTFSIAMQDARCRLQGLSLFRELNIPQSHALLTEIKSDSAKLLNELKTQGFSRVKVKTSKDNLNALKNLLKGTVGTEIQFRLDFNGALSAGEFHQVLKELEPHLEKIEFFEDPLPFHLSIWKEFQKNYPIALACDRDARKAIGYPESAKFLILKPAIQSTIPFQDAPQTVIITTYADHPIGQFAAAWQAACFGGKLGICGLLSHYAYESNPFSALIKHHGPYLEPPSGTGLGFDQLLENLPWESVV